MSCLLSPFFRQVFWKTFLHSVPWDVTPIQVDFFPLAGFCQSRDLSYLLLLGPFSL